MVPTSEEQRKETGHEPNPLGAGPLFSKNLYSYFLLVLLLFALYLAYRIFSPFLHTIIIAAVLAIMASPVFRWLLRKFGERRTPAALVTTLVVCFLIILPMFFLATGLAKQGAQSVSKVSEWLVENDPNDWIEDGKLEPYFEWVDERLPFLKIRTLDLGAKILEYTENLAEDLFTLSKSLLRDAADLLMKFLLLVFLLFLALRDGPAIMQRVKYLCPLRPYQEDIILESLLRVSRTVLVGSLFVAVLQGLAGGIGLSIAGIPGLFWGTMMAFAALIPVVGASIVWWPAVVFLFVSGQWEWGLFLVLWCLVVVVNIDTFLRPMLLRGANKVSPFYIFLAILGGVGAFGLLGLLYGPLVLSFVMVMLEIYGEEYKETLINSRPDSSGDD